MTTEIAILNRYAVALAADSAVTVGPPSGGQKIYTSANKIFGLSRRQPVAVMVYNADAFMGVPWDTVVKLYRDVLGESAKSTVDGYLSDFIGHLPKHPGYCSSEVQTAWLAALVRAEVENGRMNLRSVVEEALTKTGDEGIDETELSRLATELFARRLDVLQETDPIDPSWTARDLRLAHEDRMKEIVEAVCGGLPLSEAAKSLLIDTAAEFVTRRHQSSAFSGVVMAGFGEEEFFPSLAEQVVDGVIDGHLRAWPRISHVVAKEEAAIVPFAQDDMVRAFVEGVSPSYQDAIEALVSGIIDGYPGALLAAVSGLPPDARTAIEKAHSTVGPQTFQTALDELTQWRSDRFVSEIMEIVSSLPKEELAALAEALVNLTSLRRRMSRQAETVGGPVDVAVISKGDGLVWIKRKHYFDPRLNAQYMVNRYGSL